MKQKNPPPIMITAEEAAAISRYSTKTDLDLCMEIYRQYLKEQLIPTDSLFFTMCVFACMFNAGRMQEIREERAKAKLKPIKRSEGA